MRVMSKQTTKWEQVSHRFEALGDRLRSHFEQVGSQSAEERKALEHVMRLLSSTVEDGFTSAGRAVRDPAVRQDLADLATAVRDALTATVEDAGTQVRERIGGPVRRGGRAEAHKVTPRKAAPRKVTAKSTPRKVAGAKVSSKATTRKPQGPAS